jgi:hypothetical protein
MEIEKPFMGRECVLIVHCPILIVIFGYDWGTFQINVTIFSIESFAPPRYGIFSLTFQINLNPKNKYKIQQKLKRR